MNETVPFSSDSATNLTLFSTYNSSLFYTAVHVANLLLGFPTHLCVLWLMLRGWRRDTRGTEIFPLNGGVCEIFFCLRSLISVLAARDPALLPIMLLLAAFNITGRPMFQCLMCVERFLAVVHPVTFLKLKPLRYRIFCCSVAWTIILSSCAGYYQLVSPNYFHIFKWIFLSQFSVFLSVNLYCCVSVLRVLRQSGPGEKKEENHGKRRAFLIILITTVTMVITYLPSSALALHFIITGCIEFDLESITLGFFVLGGFVQPLLYFHRLGIVSYCRTL